MYKRNLHLLLTKFHKTTLVLCFLALVYMILQLTTFASYMVLSPSMEPAIKPGDYILINKWVLGGRIYNPISPHEIKRAYIYRLPSLKYLQYNDIVVFNYPFIGKGKNKHIGMNTNTYYVKRIIAIPGDTFQIRHAFFISSGYNGYIGNLSSQMYLNRIDTTNIIPKLVRAYNGIKTYAESKNKWTIYDFGPITIPKKGTAIIMNENNFTLYKEIVEWENENQKLNFYNGNVYLGHNLIRQYIFKENYYFVAGDNLTCSKDSRYWGFLPEKFIIGKAAMIWFSQNPYTKKIRWERFFKLL